MFAEEVGIGVDVDGVVVAEFDELGQSMADLLRVEVEAFAQVVVGVDERFGDLLGFGAGDVIGVAEVSREVVPDEEWLQKNRLMSRPRRRRIDTGLGFRGQVNFVFSFARTALSVYSRGEPPGGLTGRGKSAGSAVSMAANWRSMLAEDSATRGPGTWRL
ncbi:hypothetical protein [Micromonospora viridifaciens]|uniref:hypothetical protein n=1 Tax=Micromonospora viridifaciens TaxID=1881 RepID=UPI0012FD6B5B|nr:hypothetical protein [Micromonospora viridifaciens]